jgi:hypothetical protein
MLKYASYNTTVMLSDFTKGYVLPTSYFGNVANLSAIEFVAVRNGQLNIDVSLHLFIVYCFQVYICLHMFAFVFVYTRGSALQISTNNVFKKKINFFFNLI